MPKDLTIYISNAFAFIGLAVLHLTKSIFRMFNREMPNYLYRYWYNYFSTATTNIFGGEIRFLNCGYQDEGSTFHESDISTKSVKQVQCAHLYYHVVTSGGHLSLKGLDILEIGSGLGGGAEFINKFFMPSSITGLDLSDFQVENCKQQYRHIKELEFICGSATDLPFSNSSFDLVVNIESSHSYSDLKRFFAEVNRVLRPGGYFCYSDLRRKSKGSLIEVHDIVRESDFLIIESEDITSGVMKGMELMHQERGKLIREYVPRYLRKAVHNFSGTVDSDTYKDFKCGDGNFFRYCLLKTVEE